MHTVHSSHQLNGHALAAFPLCVLLWSMHAYCHGLLGHPSLMLLTTVFTWVWKFILSLWNRTWCSVVTYWPFWSLQEDFTEGFHWRYVHIYQILKRFGVGIDTETLELGSKYFKQQQEWAFPVETEHLTFIQGKSGNMTVQRSRRMCSSSVQWTSASPPLRTRQPLTSLSFTLAHADSFVIHSPLIRGLCSSTGPTQVCLVLNTCSCSTEATSVVMSSIWVMSCSQFHTYLLVMPAQTFCQLWHGDLPLHLLFRGVGGGGPCWFTKLLWWLSGTVSP